MSMITNKKINTKIIAGFLFVLLVVVFSSRPIKLIFAQVDSLSQGSNIPVPQQIPEIKEQLDINISPEVPQPGQDVTITIESYGLDLNSTNIQWLVNGKEKLRGKGQKIFTFNVGNSGESDVMLNIVPQSQPQIIRTFVFNPSNVDLLWQAETYTPPFYKGKALLSLESSVTMVAIPNFIKGSSRTSDSDVVYKWSVDREVQGDNSGYGKNYFKYTEDILSLDKTIDVEAYPSGNQDWKGTGSVGLSTKNSFLLFYEDNPTNGVMFNYSLANQVDLGARTELKISAFPYNFSVANKNYGLEYTWYVNAQNPNLPTDTNAITIKKNEKEKVDEAVVLIDASNPTHIMQSNRNGIDLLFNNK